MRFAIFAVLAALFVLVTSCGSGPHGTQDGDDDIPLPDGSAGDPDAETAPDTGTVAPCPDPRPLSSPDGAPTGLEACGEMDVHRVEALPCAEAPALAACSGKGFGPCASDADCTEGGRGRCVDDGSAELDEHCSCHYLCTTDADCADDQACLCLTRGFLASQCVPSNCRTDADCADGPCTVSLRDSCGYGSEVTNGFWCHARSDDCQIAEDCPQAPVSTCSYRTDLERWSCTERVTCE